MKKILLASAATMALAGAASAQDTITLGVLLGFTGPAESLAPGMADGAELAMAEVTESGALLGGATVVSVRGDSACDATLSVAAAERLITSAGVNGIIGALCSGATIPALTNVAMPNGMVMVSPSATSPALSTLEDNGLFFRTAPSDARQGVVMAQNILDRGFDTVAVTYTNNDYGRGLADSFAAAFAELGGTVTLVASHEDGRADYSAEVGALAAAGGDVLVVAGYIDQGGPGIIRAALDTGAFDTFVLPDGMVGNAITERFGTEINGSFGQFPGTDSEGAAMYFDLATAAGFDGTAAFSAEAYDAAALIMLAMQAAGSTVPAEYAAHIMDVANAPGEPILPGELGRALELLAAGQDIDYIGATAVELIGGGESAGAYREIEVVDGVIQTVNFR
ncbi:ABC transporter substrate-binding protein [Roseicyclus mahoneyensis]|uniref:Amino acid/amide ABC transporter substrate-binding protein (HAAT family) n=1 Tax=Roseicyclus mahoneyensis TaxID=164332 RepID=A0A316GR52_9RHOB|nr:ABC transporter substrate-binding protein [Roseicyclus mahoneyensis]PWK62492.1 amino acid/amide ABC transporter substrate-binding protein (HAAT family) [Roseicyclus mahoneyensis]